MVANLDGLLPSGVPAFGDINIVVVLVSH